MNAVDAKIAHDKQLKQYVAQAAECLALFDARNQQYKGSFRTLGVVGILYEFNGIAGRLRALRDDLLRLHFSTFVEDVEDNRAQLRDKLMDAVNYGLMALMLLEDENILGEG